MAVKTKTRTRATATKPTATKAKATKAPAKASNRVSAEEHARRLREIPKRLASGESLSVVAADFGIRSNIAHGYVRQAEFDGDPSLAIKGKNEVELLKRVNAARQAADEHSSWGWLSTRTGINEGTLKTKMAEAGYDVKGTNVASVRKANRPAPAKKTAPAAKTTKATKTKGTARRTRKTASPS